MSFALGSIVATFHDVLVTLAFLVFFRYEMSLNIIAAMLTMVGYSMNDMIVIFDRVRENSRKSRKEPLDQMINTSLNQTLTRTVITSGTVFLAVLALYLFGGEVLEGFAFTMLVGTLATTYSGWFIAPSHRDHDERARLSGRRRRERRAGPAAADAQAEAAAQGQGVVSALAHRSSGRAPRGRPGTDRVSAGFLHGAPARRAAAPRLRGSGRRLRRHDPARDRFWP